MIEKYVDGIAHIIGDFSLKYELDGDYIFLGNYHTVYIKFLFLIPIARHKYCRFAAIKCDKVEPKCKIFYPKSIQEADKNKIFRIANCIRVKVGFHVEFEVKEDDDKFFDYDSGNKILG